MVDNDRWNHRLEDGFDMATNISLRLRRPTLAILQNPLDRLLRVCQVSTYIYLRKDAYPIRVRHLLFVQRLALSAVPECFINSTVVHAERTREKS